MYRVCPDGNEHRSNYTKGGGTKVVFVECQIFLLSFGYVELQFSKRESTGFPHKSPYEVNFTLNRRSFTNGLLSYVIYVSGGPLFPPPYSSRRPVRRSFYKTPRRVHELHPNIVTCFIFLGKEIPRMLDLCFYLFFILLRYHVIREE